MSVVYSLVGPSTHEEPSITKPACIKGAACPVMTADKAAKLGGKLAASLSAKLAGGSLACVCLGGHHKIWLAETL